MPPLYVLNPPVNPFWDFVAGLEDHPFFNGQPGNTNSDGTLPSRAPRENAWASRSSEQPAEPEMSETAKGKQATSEDPPEVDPATVRPGQAKFADAKVRSEEARERFRRRGRCARDTEDNEEGDRRFRGGPCHGRGRGRFGWGGPPPFSPFFAQPPWHDQSSGPHPPPGPPPPGHHGPPHRGPPHHGPHRGHHHGPRGPHHRGSPHHPRPAFDLGEFLNTLGDKLGVDLAGAAEGFGLTTDRFSATKATQEVDFEPRCDIFENKSLYTVHLSLPGAKKSDIGVDYDGEHSVLRVTGVVHRPEIDEQMLDELVVDGRKRETGVFEKAIRLGTKRDPASIDVASISAKMTDGVLVVRIPKVDKVIQNREVPISADPIDAGQANYEDEYSEKPVLFDADEHASTADNETNNIPEKGEISLIDREDDLHGVARGDNGVTEEKTSSKAKEAEKEASSSGPPTQSEQLPAYSQKGEREDEDWENFSDASGEAEYVKIDVK